MNLVLVARDPGDCALLQRAFSAAPTSTGTAVRNTTSVFCGSIAQTPYRGPDVALVTAGNSFGEMNGGVDGIINTYLSSPDERMHTVVKRAIASRYLGEQPVGTCLLVPSLRPSAAGYLAHAVTMRVPQDVSDTLNSYTALRSALVEIVRHNARLSVDLRIHNSRTHNSRSDTKIRTIVCPLLCTGAGGMDVVTSARQMRRAWDAVFGQDAVLEPLSDWQRIWARERALLG